MSHVKTISKVANSEIPPPAADAGAIIQDSLDHTLFSWSKQKGIAPIAVKYGEGV